MTIVSVSAPVQRILDVSGIGTVLTEAEPSSRREMSEREVE